MASRTSRLANPRAQFRDGISRSFAKSPKNRHRRINALGAAVYRPEVLAEIARHQSAHYDNVAGALAILQDRGLIDASVSLRAFSSWFLGLVLSRFFAEIDEPSNLDAWSSQTVDATLTVLGLPPRRVP